MVCCTRSVYRLFLHSFICSQRTGWPETCARSLGKCRAVLLKGSPSCPASSAPAFGQGRIFKPTSFQFGWRKGSKEVWVARSPPPLFVTQLQKILLDNIFLLDEDTAREMGGSGNKLENTENCSPRGHKQCIPQVFLELSCHQKRKTEVGIPDKTSWSCRYGMTPSSWVGPRRLDWL